MNDDACIVLEQLTKNSFFVGGAVRDRLMGRVSHDIDITTDLLPDEILEIFPDGNTIGARFGTIIVNTPSGTVDITTMRKDITPGVHPDVAFTNILREDLERRDLTINAMAMSVDGKLIDYFNGQQDIKLKTLRAVGNATTRIHIEDPRRAIRTARFVAQLGFGTTMSLFNAIRNVNMKIVDGDFIRQEIEKGFKYDAPRMVEAMVDLNLMSKTIPEVIKLRRCGHNPIHHADGDAFNHTLESLRHYDGVSFTIKIAILLHDIGKPRVKDGWKYHGHAEEGVQVADRILKRLKFSNNNIQEILFCINNHMKMHAISNMRRSKRYALYDSPHFKSLLEVHLADAHGRENMLDFITSDIPARMPTRLVSGHDLIALGLPADKTLGPILQELYDIQIEEDITDKTILLEYLI